jgi:predicted O-linked N-acetylglucosamine transferase (SPINDLY family)
VNRKERRAGKRRNSLAENQSQIGQDFGESIAVLWNNAQKELAAGFPSKALPFLQKIVSFDPNNNDFLFNYGACLFETGDYFAASVQFKKALETGLKNEQLIPLLGSAYNKAGLYEDAITTYKNAIEISNRDIVSIDTLWSIFYKLKRYEEATSFFSYIIKKHGSLPSLVLVLGQAYFNLEKYIDADLMFSELLSADKQNQQALQYLAAIKLLTGEVYQAIDLYRKAAELSGCLDVCQSDYLMSLNYSDQISQTELIKYHNSWADKLTAEISPVYNKKHNFKSERPLRLGYVSSDFRYHAVANFVTPILEAHDRQKFILIGYYNEWFPDPQTAIIKNLFNEWRNIKNLSAKEVCDQIVEDKIDILIDLNGHTAGNTLAVFRKKPAPLQISWLGYPNATGLEQIDFIVADKIVAPPKFDECYPLRSSPLRLDDGYHCYHQMFESKVTELPAITKGYITFGSFNALAKLTTKTINLWSSVLKAVPETRLLIKRSPLKIKSVRSNLLKRFQHAGVDISRILISWDIESTAEHLEEYSKVDIALDTFPYNGATTTCDALWMGVPVVTLCGKVRSSRVSASILSQIRRSEWIASSTDEYVEISLNLASSLSLLREIRRDLRHKIINSSLYKNELVTNQFESALRKEWKQLCKKRTRNQSMIQME